MFKNAKKLEKERERLLEEKRYTRSVYLPLKTGMRFSQILRYKNWVHMLNTSTDTDSETLDSITRMVKIILEIKEAMVAVEPFATRKVLLQAVKQRSCPSEPQYKGLYSFLQHLSKEAFTPI
jgi:hypothetical protein